MKITAHLHFKKYDWEEEGIFELWPCKLDSSGSSMFLKTLEVQIPDEQIPSSEEIINWQVTGLREAKESILAECHMKVSALDEKIQQLLCLPNIFSKEAEDEPIK